MLRSILLATAAAAIVMLVAVTSDAIALQHLRE
jgi:hypothetical protein